MFLASLLLLLAAVSAPRVARACGPCECPARYQARRVVPSASGGVPRNVRFFVDVTGLEEAQIAVTDAAGAAVELLVVPVYPGAQAYWVSAKSPLAPMAAYTLSLNASWSESFTTGADENALAPEVGALTLSAPLAAAGFCEAYDGINVELASFEDHGQPFNRGVLEVEFGEVHGFFPLYALSPIRSAVIGDGAADCFGVARVPGLKADVLQRVVLTVWDSSGHGARLPDVKITPQHSVPGSCWTADTVSSSGDASVEAGDVQDAARPKADDGCQLVTNSASASGILPWLALLAFAYGTRRRT